MPNIGLMTPSETAGRHGAPGPLTSGPDEQQMLTFARQTRNATVFIAWIVGIGVAAAIIVGIILGVQEAKVASELGNSSSGAANSSCVSQGGSVPGC